MHLCKQFLFVDCIFPLIHFRTEISKTSEELKQLRMHYDSKCEDFKLMESKSVETKTAYETHIKHLTTR